MITCVCRFCQKDARYAPIAELDAHGMKVYFCDECSAEYVFYAAGLLSHYSLYTTINTKMYRWTRSMSAYSGGRAWLRYIETPGIPGAVANKDVSLIKTFFGDVPDITPQNINEKLKTYLVFI